MSDACASSSATSHSDLPNCDDVDLDLSKLFNVDDSKPEKTNALSIYCPRCPSLILRPGHGVYVNDVRRDLPNMQIRLDNRNGQNVDLEKDISHYQHFWRVDDIFTFENAGYTNTVDGRFKYLTCADCECGPLGVQVIDDENISDASKKTHFSYLALARVIHR